MESIVEKKKRILKLIIVILIILLLSVGGFFGYKVLTDKKVEPKKEEKQEVKSSITPLLYEVTKEGSENKMYLFGTIHAANANDLVFPEYVLNAYNNSHYLACELDLVAYNADQEKVMENTTKLLYSDGTTIKDHLSEETYNKLVDFLTKNNSYTSIYDSYNPFFFVSLITAIQARDAKINTQSGIDTYFLKKAKTDNKTIIELESYESQLGVFTSLPDAFFDLYFKETIDNYNTYVESLKNLYNAWKEGNPEALYEYGSDDMKIKEEYTEEQKKVMEEYNNSLVVNRNNEMTKKAIELFDNNQDVFYMVGALHIVGDTGLAKQLEQKGYIVKKVS